MINDKHTKRYSAANRSAWVITSNAYIPLPLEDGDRRFMVVETPREPWPEEDYQEVVDWLEAGGDAMVISWLHRRWDKLSAARRKVLFGRAPVTDAKVDLIEVAAEGIEGAVRLAIAGRHCTPWPDLMRLDDAVARLKHPLFELLPDQLRRQVSTQRVITALKAAGAVKLSAARSSSTAIGRCACGACAQAKCTVTKPWDRAKHCWMCMRTSAPARCRKAL